MLVPCLIKSALRISVTCYVACYVFLLHATSHVTYFCCVLRCMLLRISVTCYIFLLRATLCFTYLRYVLRCTLRISVMCYVVCYVCPLCAALHFTYFRYVVGGLWSERDPEYRDKEGISQIYKCLITNTSKEAMAFSDFPMPDNYPVFLTPQQVSL